MHLYAPYANLQKAYWLNKDNFVTKKENVSFYYFTHKAPFYLMIKDNINIKKIVKVTKAKSLRALWIP